MREATVPATKPPPCPPPPPTPPPPPPPCPGPGEACDSLVGALRGLGGELRVKVCVGVGLLGNHHHAGREAVQAVHDARPDDAAAQLRAHHRAADAAQPRVRPRSPDALPTRRCLDVSELPTHCCCSFSSVVVVVVVVVVVDDCVAS